MFSFVDFKTNLPQMKHKRNTKAENENLEPYIGASEKVLICYM